MGRQIKLVSRKKVIASPLSLDEQREIYNEVLDLKKKYNGFPGFGSYFKFDETQGIRGSNLSHMLLVNKILAEKGERTPSFYESMKLDKEGKLTKKGYRDYGIVVYDNSEPNKELADKLVVLANKRNWKFPILVHFSGLDFDNKNKFYKFTQDDSQIISGEEAVEQLKRFVCKRNSGVRRVDRFINGVWSAYWDNLLSSYNGGRVDWKCVEEN